MHFGGVDRFTSRVLMSGCVFAAVGRDIESSADSLQDNICKREHLQLSSLTNAANKNVAHAAAVDALLA